MTVHMVRVIIGPNDKMTLQQANDELDKWVNNHSEWVEDSTEHHVRETNTDPSGSGVTYWRGSYRFEYSDAKDNLLQKCEDKLTDKCDWYRLGYHVCDHDESDRQGCSWDDEREWTAKDQSIPSDVPTFVK